MADGADEAANAFSNELRTPESGTQPRDQSGKFVQVRDRPEPMFGEREIEGDPFTGDTRDGGDDEALRARERRIADGHDQGQRRSASDAQDLRRTADADDEGIPFESEERSDAVPAEVGEDDDDEKYEVVINGAKHEVTLREALTGYVSQEMAAQRMAALDQMQAQIAEEHGRQQQSWALLLKGKADYEDDLRNLMPQEPDWDRLYAENPQGAHQQQKIYQALYAKLAQSYQQRAQLEAARVEEVNRRTQQYAIDGFSKFVLDNKIPDEPTLKKEISSMRRTASDAGFSEYEVATVYDPRMLTVLRWASKYRRMTMARPRAVVAGKGRTLTPGSAGPIGSTRRGGLDDAQRQLASSGKLSDAVEVFRRIL